MSVGYQGYTKSAAFATLDPDKEIAQGIAYFQRSLLPLLPTEKSARILEIGCGYGKNLLALRNAGYRNVFGIDISPDQIEYAHTRFDLTMVEQADCCEWLESNETSFECILIIDVLEHLSIADLCRVAALLDRNLSPKGMVLVQVPNDLAPFSPIRAGDLTHRRAFTTQSLKQFFVMSDLAEITFHKPGRIGGILSRLVRSCLVDPVAELFMSILFRSLYGQLPSGLLFSANIIGRACKSDIVAASD